jgi:PleD family two-component response regulator
VAVPGTAGRKAPEVLAAADKALYRAKKAGRNRVAA